MHLADANIFTNSEKCITLMILLSSEQFEPYTVNIMYFMYNTVIFKILIVFLAVNYYGPDGIKCDEQI